MDEFQKWWDETYGQILTITNDPGADASCRIAKIAALDAWKAGIAALEAERDAYKAEAKLLEHKVITCGVAASHSDADLTRTGAYAEKWNSQQAEQVRALRAERDALRADAERLDFLGKWAVICKPGEPIRAAIDRERAAIAAKEPNRE